MILAYILFYTVVLSSKCEARSAKFERFVDSVERGLGFQLGTSYFERPTSNFELRIASFELPEELQKIQLVYSPRTSPHFLQCRVSGISA